MIFNSSRDILDPNQASSWVNRILGCSTYDQFFFNFHLIKIAASVIVAATWNNTKTNLCFLSQTKKPHSFLNQFLFLVL